MTFSTFYKNLNNRFKSLTLSLAHNIIYHFPSNTTINLIINDSPRFTRHRPKYLVPLLKLDTSKRSFIFLIPHLLNQLTQELELDVLNLPKHIFNKHIKNFIMNHP